MKVEEMVGRRIREAREAVGLSQEDLGRALLPYLGKRWPGQQVSVAEDGGRKFTAAELFALCVVLARPASYFFLPVGNAPIEVPNTTTAIKAKLVRGIQMWGSESDGSFAAPALAAITETQPDLLRAVEDAARSARENIERAGAELARLGHKREQEG